MTEEQAQATQEYDTQDASRDDNKLSYLIKFYGLYWKKSLVDWESSHMLGEPKGWIGKGRPARGTKKDDRQMNFWKQKGVYVLYDSNLYPVYAGQAGLIRKETSEGQSIGSRINNHREGFFRNGWEFFSWFGFLETEPVKLKSKTITSDQRMDPSWEFVSKSNVDLNTLLGSFEAILIEGFSPRFNSRGGDLKGAVIVDQFEK